MSQLGLPLESKTVLRFVGNVLGKLGESNGK